MAKIKKAGSGDSYTDYAKKSGKPDSVTDYAGKTSKPDSYTQYRKGGVVKKAQSGEFIAKKSLREGQVKRLERIDKANPDRAVKVAKRMLKRAEPMMKNGGMKKAKSGFGMLSVKAGVDNNPNPTFADKIAGAKKKAMSGMEMMKMGGKAAKQAAIAIAMKKAGKTPKKKMKSGGTVSMQLGSYDRQIGKNYTGKNVVNKGAKAKMGKSIMKMGGKCKNGC